MALGYCDYTQGSFRDRLRTFGLQGDSDMNLQHELDVARSVALEAGRRLRDFHLDGVELNGLVSNEIVTIPDLVADDIVVSGLRKAFPQDAVCSEQSPTCWDRFQCDRLWLVDALDGAASLASGGDEYTVSIGLAIRGQAVLGVVYNPVRDELYAGSTMHAVTLNGEPVSEFRESPSTEDGISVQRSEWGYIFGCVPELLSISKTSSVSYDLARIAAGTHDGWFSLLPPREWCTCAGIALICAAGRLASVKGGAEITYNNEDLRHPAGIIAARTPQHKEFMEYIVSLPEMEEVAQDLRRRSYPPAA